MPVSQTSMRSLSPRRRHPSRILAGLGVFRPHSRARLRIICASNRGSLRTLRPLRNHAQVEAIDRLVIGELAAQLVEHGIDRKINDLAADDPRLELVDVEERVEHPGHRAHRLAEPVDQPEDGLVGDLLRHEPLQEAQRLQRLPEIVAGRGEEARFAEIGLFGLALGGAQRFRRAPALGNVVDRQQDLGLPMRSLAQLASIEQQQPPAEGRELDLDLVILGLRGIGLHPFEEGAQTLGSGVMAGDDCRAAYRPPPPVPAQKCGRRSGWRKPRARLRRARPAVGGSCR